MLFLLLAGCDWVQGVVFDVHTSSGAAQLTGYVYRGPFPDAENSVVTGDAASLDFYDLGGEILASAEEQYPSTYPGYWRVELPVETDYQLVISDPDYGYPALWRGKSPPESGLFPPSASVGTGTRAGLFGWPASTVDPFFESVAVAEGVEIESLDPGTLVHLWGGPADRESIRGDRIHVVDGSGQEATVFAYAIDEDASALVRTAGSPVDYFLAFNLAPGDIVVSFEDESGQIASTTYAAVGGEIVAPWFFRGP